MGISGVGARSHATVQSLVEMRRQLDELQRQLGSGKKANTYAGLGLDSGLTVSLRSRLSTISGYADAMTTIGVRIDLAQTTLTRLARDRQAGEEPSLLNPAVIVAGGQTATQEAAKERARRTARPPEHYGRAIATCFPGAASTKPQWRRRITS